MMMQKQRKSKPRPRMSTAEVREIIEPHIKDMSSEDLAAAISGRNEPEFKRICGLVATTKRRYRQWEVIDAVGAIINGRGEHVAWRQNTDTLHVLSDKYAWRFVQELEHRCTAVKFYPATATYSDRVAFWYKNYASREDAISAAKIWLMRGELEKAPSKPETYKLAAGTYIEPEPELEQRRW